MEPTLTVEEFQDLIDDLKRMDRRQAALAVFGLMYQHKLTNDDIAAVGIEIVVHNFAERMGII